MKSWGVNFKIPNRVVYGHWNIVYLSIAALAIINAAIGFGVQHFFAFAVFSGVMQCLFIFGLESTKRLLIACAGIILSVLVVFFIEGIFAIPSWAKWWALTYGLLQISIVMPACCFDAEDFESLR